MNNMERKLTFPINYLAENKPTMAIPEKGIHFIIGELDTSRKNKKLVYYYKIH